MSVPLCKMQGPRSNITRAVFQGFSSPRVRLPVEPPLQDYGAPTETDNPSTSTGPPPSRRQRPLREVLANGTAPMQLDSAASMSGSDQEQSSESLPRPPSAAGTLVTHPTAKTVIACTLPTLELVSTSSLPDAHGMVTGILRGDPSSYTC